jgi:hypothetical protein
MSASPLAMSAPYTLPRAGGGGDRGPPVSWRALVDSVTNAPGRTASALWNTSHA